jgi:hypothetical protein
MAISANGIAAQQLHKAGHGARKIARLLKESITNVYRWINTDPTKQRKVQLTDPRVTRRQKFVRQIAKVIEKDEKGVSYPKFPSAPAIQDELWRKHHIDATPRLIRKDLVALGMVNRVRKKVPCRQAQYIKKRLVFAKGIKKYMIKRMLFSDEHIQGAMDFTNRCQWVDKGHETVPRERMDPRTPPRVQVWAAIGYNFKSKLVFFPSDDTPGDKDAWNAKKKKGWRLNGPRYVKRCLTPMVAHLKRKGMLKNAIFQQDNASPHNSKEALTYSILKGLNVLKDWPPYSPDLNPIEHLWASMKRRVAMKHPRTQQGLIDAMNQFWNDLTLAEINKYVLGFGPKIDRCIKKKGHP